MDDVESQEMTAAAAPAGHMMAANDPDNPQNWPVHRKVYASAVGFTFSWVVYALPSFLLSGPTDLIGIIEHSALQLTLPASLASWCASM